MSTMETSVSPPVAAASERGSPPEPGMKWKKDKRAPKGGYWYKPGKRKGTSAATSGAAKRARPTAGATIVAADGGSTDVSHAAGELLVVRSDVEDKIWLCEVTEDAAIGQEHVRVNWLNEVHAGVYEAGAPEEVDADRLLGVAELVELEHGKFYFTEAARNKAEQLLHSKERGSGDADMPDEDDGGEDAATPAKKRARREASPKRDKQVKAKPVITPLELDPFWDPFPEGKLKLAGVVDNIQVLHDKLAIRAVLQNDAAELRRLAADLQGTCSLHRPLNPFKAETALQLALVNHRPELVDIFVEERKMVADAAKEKPPRSRAIYPSTSLSAVDSGSVGWSAYRAHVRKVKLSRGGREGNQAFAKDLGAFHSRPCYPFQRGMMQKMLRWMLTRGAKLSAFKQCYEICLKGDSLVEGDFHQLFGQACRSGDVDVAFWMGEMALNNEGWGLNGLHTAVLKKIEESAESNLFPTFKAISYTKKATANFRIMPILVAAINPDTRVLKAVVQMIGGSVKEDIHEDEEGRSVLHYAAACQTSDNLKFLLEELGMQPDAKSMYNTTPLMVSCMMGRVDCVTLLLEKSADPTLSESSTLSLPPKKNRRRGLAPEPSSFPDGLNAAHLCVEYEQIECLKVLLSKGLPVDNTDNFERRTLLHRACAGSCFSIAIELLNAKASLTKRDKLQRTPLILAAAGGSAKLCSHLLAKKATVEDVDSSGNSALHYAAGYGWLHVVELLTEAGAKLIVNSWKASPVMIALMKSHFGLVQWFVENATDIDLEQTTEEGNTLLALACKTPDARWAAVFQILLKRGADVNTRDVQGMTPLHHLAAGCRQESDEDDEDEEEEEHEAREKEKCMENAMEAPGKSLLQLLAEHKAELDATDQFGRTPLLIALQQQNWPAIKTLLRAGADPSVCGSDGKNILHIIAGFAIKREAPQRFGACGVMSADFKSTDSRPNLLSVLAMNCPPERLSEMAQTRDYEGMTPLHCIVNSFVSDFQQLQHFRNAFMSYRKLDDEQFAIESAARRKFFSDFLDLYLKVTKSSLLLLTSGPKPSKAEVDKAIAAGFQTPSLGQAARISETTPAVPLTPSGQAMELVRLEEAKPARCFATGAEIAPGQACWKNTDDVLAWKATSGAGRTVVHLLAALDDPESMRALLDRIGGSADKRASQLDVCCNSPLSVAMTAPNKDSFACFGKLLSVLIAASDASVFNTKPPLKDAKTPMIMAAELMGGSFASRAIAAIKQMLEARADLSVGDSLGKTPLHLGCQGRSQELVETLLAASADPAVGCKSKRTALHYLVNASKGEESFQLERRVLAAAGSGRAALVNARDSRGRTAIHYAFVKFDSDSLSPVCVENVGKSIVWQFKGNRCLVQAFKDDSPKKLGVSVGMQLSRIGQDSVEGKAEHEVRATHKSSHGTDSMLMLRKPLDNGEPLPLLCCGTESRDPVESVTSLCVEELDINASDMYGMTPLHYAAAHGATISTLTLLRRSADLHKVDGFGHDVLGRALLAGHRDYAIMLIQKGLSALGHLTASLGDDDVKKSYFWQAMIKGQYGVAYLLIDEGYPLFEAIQDVLDLSKTNMAITLLGKVREDVVVQKTVPASGDGLLHVLARCKIEKLGADGGTQVADALRSRGLAISATNLKNETPLHVAAYQQNRALVKWLMKFGGEGKGQPAAAIDSFGRAPIHCALFNAPAETKAMEILEDLGEATGVELMSACVAKSTNDTPEKTTLLICAIGVRYFNFAAVLVDKYKVNVSVPDSSGLTPLMWAVKMNSMSVVQKLIAAKAKVDAVDDAACSALHYCIQPLAFGSYENVDLLKLLCESRASVDMRNKAGKTPLALAYGQDSGRMARVLKDAGATTPADPSKFQRLKSGIMTWQKSEVDFETEASLAIAEATASTTEKREPRAVHQCYGMDGQNEVLVIDDTVYDVMMVKVDVKKGEYGENNFYHMQLIHEKVKDLYVLFTRWGRIGETGMYQRTPLGSREEALKEWGKVFKSKSGNDWAKRDEFEKQPKRYSLLSLENAGLKRAELLKPFAEKPPVESKLSPSLQRTMKTMTSLALMLSVLKKHSINVDVMPFTRLSRAQLQAGLATLKAVADQVAAVQDLKKTPGVGLAPLQAAKERLLELSSEYYTLIPKASGRSGAEPMGPIKTDRQVTEEWNMLQDLLEMEVASKVLLAAKHVENDTHPLDYVYSALNTEMEALSPTSEEFKLLRKYLVNTAEGSTVPRISTIYRVQRRGEAARMEAWTGLGRHRLLWHGTGTSNLVGILAQGLRIAPPEAPMTGYAFGKGLYFADMFTKSVGYCGGSGPSDTKYLLLAEVALGDMLETSESVYMEAAAPGTHSTHALGKRGPDWGQQSVFLPNGVQIPIGQPVNREADQVADKPTEKTKPVRLSFNEFIVYDASQVRLRYLVELNNGPSLEDAGGDTDAGSEHKAPETDFEDDDDDEDEQEDEE